MGHFSGDGHKISNLEITPGYYSGGLFGIISGKDGEFSVIEKLDMDNLSVNASRVSAGGLVGYMRSATVKVSSYIEPILLDKTNDKNGFVAQILKTCELIYQE